MFVSQFRVKAIIPEYERTLLSSWEKLISSGRGMLLHRFNTTHSCCGLMMSCSSFVTPPTPDEIGVEDEDVYDSRNIL